MDSIKINKYWARVIDTLSEALMIIDINGKILAVNRVFEEMTGYTTREITGRPCTVLRCDACKKIVKNDSSHWCTLFEHPRSTIRKCRCEILKKDGTYLPARKNASSLFDEKGCLIGAVETLTDLSELDRRDQRIAFLSQQLFETDNYCGIIGRSKKMKNVFGIIEKAAQSDAPVIVYGESGTGKELVALHRLRLIARRLAGGIRVADNSQIVVPDPERSTMLTVYSPVWLTPEAAEVLLKPFGPGVVSGLRVADEAPSGTGPSPEETESVLEVVGAEAMDAAWSIARQDAERLVEQDEDQELDGYGVVVPVDASRPGWGHVELRVRGVDGMPLAVWGESWATGEGVIRYVLTWHPLSEADAFAETLEPQRATERRAARDLIEQAATVVLGAVGGVVVDDAGFLVSLID